MRKQREIFLIRSECPYSVFEHPYSVSKQKPRDYPPCNSVVSDEIWPKFKLIHNFMYVLVTYKDEENQMKNEGARVVTTLYSYIFDAQGQLTL